MLAGAVAILSAFVKNIGALAMMIPIAMQMAKRSNARRPVLLMPMAFRLAARRHDDVDRHVAEHHRVAAAH